MDWCNLAGAVAALATAAYAITVQSTVGLERRYAFLVKHWDRPPLGGNKDVREQARRIVLDSGMALTLTPLGFQLEPTLGLAAKRRKIPPGSLLWFLPSSLEIGGLKLHGLGRLLRQWDSEALLMRFSQPGDSSRTKGQLKAYLGFGRAILALLQAHRRLQWIQLASIILLAASGAAWIALAIWVC